MLIPHRLPGRRFLPRELSVRGEGEREFRPSGRNSRSPDMRWVDVDEHGLCRPPMQAWSVYPPGATPTEPLNNKPIDLQIQDELLIAASRGGQGGSSFDLVGR